MQIKHWQIAYLSVLCAVILLIYSSFGVLLSQGKFFARINNGEIMLTDFCNIYSGGLMARDARRLNLNLYDPGAQLSYTLRVTDPIKPDKPFYLQYPPYAFAAFSSVTFVPMWLGWLLWNLVGLALTIYSLLYLMRGTITTPVGRALAFACIFSSYPVWLEFGMGQLSTFILPAFVLFFESLRNSNFRNAALSTIIISLKLQYMPICTMIGLVRGRAQFLLWMIVVALFLLLVSYAIGGWSNLAQYPHALAHGETSSSFSGVSGVTMQNIRGWLGLVFKEDNRFIHGIAAGAMVAAIIGIARLYYKPASADFSLLVCMTIPLMLFTSLHSHVYDMTYMVIPCLLLWRYQSEMQPKMRLALRILCLGFPPMSWIFATARPFFSALYIQPYSLWSLCLFAIAALLLRSHKERTTS